jgi:hypothetical protein
LDDDRLEFRRYGRDEIPEKQALPSMPGSRTSVNMKI